MVMAKKPYARPRTSPTSESRLLPPPGHLTIRMYRQGLGDCFLIAIGTAVETEPQYVLIDCGVHFRQDADTKRIDEVLKNLVTATGGTIHVVVATHEHADHLSGFIRRGSPFLDGRLKVEQFWVAWTEKVGDDLADRLRARRSASRGAINRAVEKLRQSNASLSSRIQGILDFETLPAADMLDPALVAAASVKAKPSASEITLDFLKRHAEKVHYCEPGEMLAFPGADSLRAFVLGPPRDMDLLKRSRPQEGAKATRETYLAGRVQHKAFMSSPGLDEDDGGKLAWLADRKVHEDLRHPFEETLRRKYRLRDAETIPKWTKECPPTVRSFFSDKYFNAENWRRIDGDWMGVAEELALDLDSDTNNTCLALAFEWGPPGQGDVLLFAADAQVGNWLSWRDQVYRADNCSLSAEELLSRIILYKVGHHGSHNATLKYDPDRTSETSLQGVPFGLELMPSRMIAMIPVDRAAVEKPYPRPWHMPHPPMYRRLLEKSSGRVLRSDGLSPEPEVGSFVTYRPNSSVPAPVPGLTKVKWSEAPTNFSDGRTCPLYYDVEFEK